jgi:sugar phosphate isomerase/epimerase
VSHVSLAASTDELRTRVESLWLTVCELVVTVHEDRPTDSGLAAVDDLAERVSELQADVDDARQAVLRTDTIIVLPGTLPTVSRAVGRAQTRYWRDLCGYEPVRQLRTATRTRGADWHAWRRSVGQALDACEEPLRAAETAVQDAWAGLAELVSLGLLAPDPTATSSTSTDIRSRRTS